MRLIVHIGTAKTGTTTIQSLLHMNRDVLYSRGYHFLQCAGPRNNLRLAMYCANDGHVKDFFRNGGIQTSAHKATFRENFLSKFNRELSGLDPRVHTVIMSSEQLAERLRSKEEVQRFRDLVGPWFSEFRVLCYLREQCEMATSLYSTMLRHGGTNSFGQHLADCAPGKSRYNYLELLNRWSEVWGAETLTVRKFNRDAFVGQDLILDFITYLSPGLTEVLDRNIKSHNVSISAFGQRLLLAINRLLNSMSGNRLGRRHYIRRSAMRFIDSVFRGLGLASSRSDYERIYHSFCESNRQVNRTFFGEDGALFEFKPPR